MMQFFAAVMLSISMIMVPSIEPAQAGWRTERCKFQTLDGKNGWTNEEVRRTIKCGVNYYNTSGGLSRALCYAEHESGFNEHADNPISSAAGIYQIVQGTWNSMYTTYIDARKWWPITYNRYNPRSNILMALKHVKVSGWGAWSNWASYSCP